MVDGHSPFGRGHFCSQCGHREALMRTRIISGGGRSASQHTANPILPGTSREKSIPSGRSTRDLKSGRDNRTKMHERATR